MSEIELEQEELPNLSPLQVFLIKNAAVTTAVLFVLFAASQFLGSLIDNRAEQFKILKGGHTFWAGVESKLYSLADEPDIPPEKKKKIIAALRRLSLKYRPYLEALAEPPKGREW